MTEQEFKFTALELTLDIHDSLYNIWLFRTFNHNTKDWNSSPEYEQYREIKMNYILFLDRIKEEGITDD